MQTNLILEKLTGIESMLVEQKTGIESMLVEQKTTLTFKQAATYIDVSCSHLYKLTSQAKIPHFKPQNKKIYFCKAELDRWLLTNRITPTDEVEAAAATHIVSGRKGAK